MSSKKSSAARLARHDAAVAARSIAAPLGVFLAFFIITCAVSTAAIPDISVFNIDYTHDQLKFRLWADAMTYPVTIGAVVFGAAVAFAAFRFTMIKVQATAYLSLPLSRARISTTRVLVSMVGMLVVLAIAIGASAAVNVIALGTWEGEATQIIYVFAGLFVCAATGYAIMLAAILLAGTQTEALLFGASLLAAVSIVCLGVNVLMSQLLVGNAAGMCLIGTQTQVAPSLLASSATCNPLLFFASAASSHQSFLVMPPDAYIPASCNWGLLGAWALFFVVLLLADTLLFIRRPGEKAGIAGLCPAMTAVFTLISGLAIFSAAFYALANLSLVWGVVAGLVCFGILAALLLRGPLKGAMGARCRLLIATGGAVAMLVCAAILWTGAFGWSAKVPSASQVESVSVSYTGAPSAFSGKVKSASSSSNSSYLSGTICCSDTANIELVTSVHQGLVASGSKDLATNAFDFSQTIVSYDIEISYNMADGSTLTRYYSQASLEQLASLLQLEDSEELGAARAALASGDTSSLDEQTAQDVQDSLTAQAYASGSILIADKNLSCPLQLSVTPAARKELLAALAADMQEQTAQQRYYPDETCQGVLMFTQSGQGEAESFAYQLGNAIVYLDSSYPKTLAWLKDKGLLASLEASASDIGEVTVVRYDPYARKSINNIAPTSQFFAAYRSTSADDFIVAPEYGSRLTVKNASKIKKLAAKMRANYYMDQGGYLVCAYVKSSQFYSYFFLPASQAPKWLVKQAG